MEDGRLAVTAETCPGKAAFRYDTDPARMLHPAAPAGEKNAVGANKIYN